MNDLPALITAITALVTALGGLAALVLHTRTPTTDAHPLPSLAVTPLLATYAGNSTGTTVTQAPVAPVDPPPPS